jgi:predicted DNA-binding helix-hairpin-helix protein
MNITRKFENLADAAKYDASCASSGAEERTPKPAHNNAYLKSLHDMNQSTAAKPTEKYRQSLRA